MIQKQRNAIYMLFVIWASSMKCEWHIFFTMGNFMDPRKMPWYGCQLPVIRLSRISYSKWYGCRRDMKNIYRALALKYTIYSMAIYWNLFFQAVSTSSNEACIGGYQISHIPWSKQTNIPYKLANIPIINFPKFSISLEVTKILNQVSHIPGSKMDSILYPWK